ncbi:MAG TPA: T9SS type B sorting domain-containing protein [Bacteroidia bacterium]|nr:T9SS type B sorting domain-containing protein [Bacteroidia bacterium]
MRNLLPLLLCLCFVALRSQSIDTICVNSGIVYQDISPSTVAPWQWVITAGNPQHTDFTQKNSPGVFYPDTGVFNVYCYITHNTGQKDTLWFITVVVDPKINDIPLPVDTAACNGVTLSLDAGNHLEVWKYRWTRPNGDSSLLARNITTNQPGKYMIFIQNRCTSATDSINVDIVNKPVVNLPENLIACNGEIIHTLDAGNAGAKFLWSTGDSTQTIDVSIGGLYKVTVTNGGGCSGEGQTLVKDSCPPEYYFPNAFTPNGDELNDLFAPYLTGIVHIRMNIYNRWGEVVYALDEKIQPGTGPITNIGWDGNFRGKAATIDVYAYTAILLTKDGEKLNLKGNLTLYR